MKKISKRILALGLVTVLTSSCMNLPIFALERYEMDDNTTKISVQADDTFVPIDDVILISMPNTVGSNYDLNDCVKIFPENATYNNVQNIRWELNGTLLNGDSLHVNNVGTYTLTVIVNQNGYKEFTKDFTLEMKSSISIGNLEINGWTYGDEPNKPTYSIDSSSLKDQAIIEYSKNEFTDYTSKIPTETGKYWVRVRIPETNTTVEYYQTKSFEILPKEVEIKGAKVEISKVYDGTTTAKIVDSGTLSENYNGDNLVIVPGTASYDDKNVGTGKKISFNGFTLGGSAAKNYKLISQPQDIIGDITPKELTINNLNIKDKIYDGNNTAEIDGKPTIEGIIDGDQINLINGVPNFDSAKVGKDIPISFTKFELSGDPTLTNNYSLIQPSGITASIAERDEFVSIENISSDNVKMEDKDKLEQAKISLERLLSSSNRVSLSEQKELEKRLERVSDILKTISNAEKVIEEIEKLPDHETIKVNDKNKVEQVQKTIDLLTENEKTMVGKERLDKVKNLLETIVQLEKEYNNSSQNNNENISQSNIVSSNQNKVKNISQKNTNIVKTGDMNNPVFWMILILICGVMIKIVLRNKKQNS